VVLQETTLGHLDEVWAHNRELPGRARWIDADHVLLGGNDQLLVIEPSSGATQMFFELEAGVLLAAEPLRDGRTAVLAKHRQGLELVLLNEFGTRVEKVELPLEPEDEVVFVPDDLTPDGTLLVGHSHLGRVDEFALDGSRLWSYRLPDFGENDVLKDVCRLQNGNTVLASSLEGGRKPGRALVEVNREGEVVWSVETGELVDLPLHHIQGIQPLGGGNLALQFSFAPHLVEISRDKRVVWVLPDGDRELRLGWIDVLEDPYRWPEQPAEAGDEDR
jgi:hypothetical protein